MDELEQWQRTVEQFGGRTDSPERSLLAEALKQANLGSIQRLPTSQVAPVFQAVTLCEMNLPIAIPVDLSFQYFDAQPTSTPAFGVGPAGLNVGTGYIQVTWGTPGTFQHSARIDGNKGWRHPFTASYLRAVYVPSDEFAAPGWEITGGQAVDLGVGAMISPASGETSKPLTKTVYCARSIVGIDFDVRVLPEWAISYQLFALPNIAAAIASVVLLDHTVAAGLLSIRSNALAGEYPSHVFLTTKHDINQPARVIGVAADAVGSGLFNATVVCELAL